MKVNTYEDVLIASEKIGVNPEHIAKVFDIEIPQSVMESDMTKELTEAISAKNVGAMWDVYDNARYASSLGTRALEAILAYAISAKKVGTIRNVFNKALSFSNVKAEALRYIVAFTE